MEFIVRERYFIQSETRNDFPPVDICERADAVLFFVDLPGINPEEVLIKIYDNHLILEGIKRQSVEERNGIFICMEREFECFRRILQIPAQVNPEGGIARYADGVIQITLPKIEDKVHKIKIIKE